MVQLLTGIVPHKSRTKKLMSTHLSKIISISHSLFASLTMSDLVLLPVTTAVHVIAVAIGLISALPIWAIATAFSGIISVITPNAGSTALVTMVTTSDIRQTITHTIVGYIIDCYPVAFLLRTLAEPSFVYVLHNTIIQGGDYITLVVQTVSHTLLYRLPSPPPIACDGTTHITGDMYDSSKTLDIMTFLAVCIIVIFVIYVCECIWLLFNPQKSASLDTRCVVPLTHTS